MSNKPKVHGDFSKRNKVNGLFVSLGLHLFVVVCVIFLMFTPKPKENYVLLELIPLGDLVVGEEAEADQQATQKPKDNTDSSSPENDSSFRESAPLEPPSETVTKSEDAIALNSPRGTSTPPTLTAPPPRITPRPASPRPTVTPRSTPATTRAPSTPSPTPTKRPTPSPTTQPTPRPSPRQTPSPVVTPTRTSANTPAPRPTTAAPRPTSPATRPAAAPSRTATPATPAPRLPPPTLPPLQTSSSDASARSETLSSDTAQAIRERLARRVGRTGVSGPEQAGQSGTRNPANLGPEVAAFYGHVRDVYHRAWRQPVREPSGHTAVLRIRLSRDGKILQSVLISPSGNSAMDESVRSAARSVTSLGRPVPEALPGETVEVSITFEY